MSTKAKSRGGIQGVAAARGGNKLSHLFFADYSILFCNASLEDWSRVKSILKQYERTSGPMINEQKSSLFFSSNGKVSMKSQIYQTIGGCISNNNDKYLGLPSLVGRSKYNSFCWLKEKLLIKLSNWKTKMLFQARKETLIKVVLQVISILTISMYQLP